MRGAPVSAAVGTSAFGRKVRRERAGCGQKESARRRATARRGAKGEREGGGDGRDPVRHWWIESVWSVAAYSTAALAAVGGEPCEAIELESASERTGLHGCFSCSSHHLAPRQHGARACSAASTGTRHSRRAAACACAGPGPHVGRSLAAVHPRRRSCVRPLPSSRGVRVLGGVCGAVRSSSEGGQGGWIARRGRSAGRGSGRGGETRAERKGTVDNTAGSDPPGLEPSQGVISHRGTLSRGLGTSTSSLRAHAADKPSRSSSLTSLSLSRRRRQLRSSALGRAQGPSHVDVDAGLPPPFLHHRRRRRASICARTFALACGIRLGRRAQEDGRQRGQRGRRHSRRRRSLGRRSSRLVVVGVAPRRGRTRFSSSRRRASARQLRPGCAQRRQRPPESPPGQLR